MPHSVTIPIGVVDKGGAASSDTHPLSPGVETEVRPGVGRLSRIPESTGAFDGYRVESRGRLADSTVYPV